MPGTEKVNKNTMVCATCDFWSGEEREPTETFSDVEYEVFQRARCMNPLRARTQTTPLARCKSWKLWAKLSKGGGSGRAAEDRQTRSSSRLADQREQERDRARLDAVLERTKQHIRIQSEGGKRGAQYEVIEPEQEEE